MVWDKSDSEHALLMDTLTVTLFHDFLTFPIRSHLDDVSVIITSAICAPITL